MEDVYYTVKLWWLSGSTLERRNDRLTYLEALGEFKRLRKHPAVKKVVMRQHVITTNAVKTFKKSGVSK